MGSNLKDDMNIGQNQNDLIEHIKELLQEQNNNYEILRLEMKVQDVRNRLKSLKNKNNEKQQKIIQLEEKIHHMQRKTSMFKRKQRQYQEKYDVLTSRKAWKWTAPIRRIGSILK
ncbi:hypothetical protein J416_01904 [Gracilibacillus halophilus YIM-C55.5]|uniref:Uncharacterized protein n=1 Tax=Gracilibacillus halophilus YIM-C55.5 TaxID=1308866 RepID=N4WFR0_9BACI|nr:hypothetical protein [Gracilibacillus halophilus]ENH98079.1 hypothetical protein J416_01904 [Gracilibacillus halophilus YIM-C55.5]